jgi:hypothetical protein
MVAGVDLNYRLHGTPFKQNSSYPVAVQYLNTQKTNLKTAPKQKNNHKNTETT